MNTSHLFYIAVVVVIVCICLSVVLLSSVLGYHCVRLGVTHNKAAVQVPRGPIQGNIPKIIHMTYYAKSKIHPKVYENIKRFAPDYELRVYDDNDCEEFMKENFPPAVLAQFHKLKGAHKADLARYCYLYKHGGVYLDIKTELITPLSTLIKHDSSTFYSVLDTTVTQTIYQGIIACPPRHPLIAESLNFVVATPWWIPRLLYIVFVVDMYIRIAKRCKRKRLRPGTYLGQSETNEVYVLLPLHVAFRNPPKSSPYHCPDGLDRYGACGYVLSSESKDPIIKLRYADFPW